MRSLSICIFAAKDFSSGAELPYRRSAKFYGNSSKKNAQEKSSNLNSRMFFFLKKIFSARNAPCTRLSPFILNSLSMVVI